MDKCIECSRPISGREHVLACDVCSSLVHRICNTGWHRRLNYRVMGMPPFYVLVDLLHREARVAGMHVSLVSDSKVRRYQRETYSRMQKRIFSCWRDYRDGLLSSSGLLKAVSLVYGPTIRRPDDDED